MRMNNATMWRHPVVHLILIIIFHKKTHCSLWFCGEVVTRYGLPALDKYLYPVYLSTSHGSEYRETVVSCEQQ